MYLGFKKAFLACTQVVAMVVAMVTKRRSHVTKDGHLLPTNHLEIYPIYPSIWFEYPFANGFVLSTANMNFVQNFISRY